jgi:hypothetical protein
VARTRSLGGIVGEAAKAPQDQIEETDQSVDRSAPPSREPKPVRLTVDISPGRHAALQQWCLDAVPGVGRPRVAGQQVMRALLARLLTDERLSRAIIADLRDHTY